MREVIHCKVDIQKCYEKEEVGDFSGVPLQGTQVPSQCSQEKTKGKEEDGVFDSLNHFTFL